MDDTSKPAPLEASSSPDGQTSTPAAANQGSDTGDMAAQYAALKPFERGLPSGRIPELRVMPMPSDANVYGDVFGGWIMAQVDIAGSLAATRRANGRIATVAVNSFVFKYPAFVGDLLSFYSEIIKVGNTSITVYVEVYAERNRLQADCVKVTEATVTYVATDAQRRPRPVPPLESLLRAPAHAPAHEPSKF